MQIVEDLRTRFGDRIDVLRAAYREFESHDISGLSAQFAYYFLFSLFPQLIFIVALLSHILSREQIVTAISTMLRSLFPQQVLTLLRHEIGGWVSTGSITAIGVSLLVFLWSGSAVFTVILRGFNRLQPGKQQHSAVRVRLLSLSLVLLITLGFGIVFLLNLFGDELRRVIAYQAPVLSRMILLNRWELFGTPFILFLLAYLLYSLVPAEHPRRLPRAIGALFFMSSLMVATALFRFYTLRSTILSVYGGLTSAIVSLLWMYVLGYLLFAGAEIYVVLLRKDHKKERQERHLNELRKDTD